MAFMSDVQHFGPDAPASQRSGRGRARGTRRLGDTRRAGRLGRAGHLGRGAGVAMLAEAVTLWVASFLHRQGQIPLGFTVVRGEHFPAASIPELVIGVVLALGALVVLAAPSRARRPALFATGFGVFGVLGGLTIVVSGGSPDTAVDLTYHSLLLAALVATFVVLLLRHPSRD